MGQPARRLASVALGATAQNPSAPAKQQLSWLLAPPLAMRTGMSVLEHVHRPDGCWLWWKGERHISCRTYVEVCNYCLLAIPNNLPLWVSCSVIGLVSSLILPILYPYPWLYLTKASENMHLCLASPCDTCSCKAKWYKVLKINTKTKMQIWNRDQSHLLFFSCLQLLILTETASYPCSQFQTRMCTHMHVYISIYSNS